METPDLQIRHTHHDPTVWIVYIVIALLIAVLILGAFITTQMDAVEARLPSIVTETQDMQTKTTKWCYKGPGGVPVETSISTERGVDESIADWCARHNTAVDAAMIEFPPVPC